MGLTLPTGQNIDVAGIVNDATLYDLRATTLLAVYVPVLQQPVRPNTYRVLVRTDGGVSSNALRQTLESHGRDYVFRVRSLSDIASNSIAWEQVTAIVAGYLGTLALAMAGMGLYGLTAYTVTLRTRELAIRYALGGEYWNVMRSVLASGLWIGVAGVAVGLGVAIATVRYGQSLLYGVTPYDPLTFAAAPVFLLAVTLAACLVPAMRAARVDPTIALRAE